MATMKITDTEDGEFAELDLGCDDSGDEKPTSSKPVVKNDPDGIRQWKRLIEKNRMDCSRAQLLLRRAERNAKKAADPQSKVLLSKTDGWEDVIDSAMSFCEDRLAVEFDWATANLSEIKTISNKDIRKINEFLSALKVLDK